MAKSDFSYGKTRFFPGFCHRAAVLEMQVTNLCTALDLGTQQAWQTCANRTQGSWHAGTKGLGFFRFKSVY